MMIRLQSANQRDAESERHDEIGRTLAGRMPGMKPPYLRSCQPMSSGAKTIEM